MTPRSLDVAVVIPTLNRPRYIDAMLASLEAQTAPPVEVVVVDAGDESAEAVVRAHPDLNVRWLPHRPPSAAWQRNAGIQALASDAGLVALLDDDLDLEPDAFQRMLEFWNGADDDVGGASLNLVEDVHPGHGALKRSGLVTRLGLYQAEAGKVAPSGWQSAFRVQDGDTYVEWLPTAAVWWRRDVLREHAFDDYFTGYSYLEDLDFSYGVSRDRRLAVVSAAKYRNALPSASRPAFAFGRMEAANRLFFVVKRRLSVPLCILGLCVRWGMTLTEAIRRPSASALWRAVGNLIAVVDVPEVVRRARRARRREGLRS